MSSFLVFFFAVESPKPGNRCLYRKKKLRAILMQVSNDLKIPTRKVKVI